LSDDVGSDQHRAMGARVLVVDDHVRSSGALLRALADGTLTGP
jgi:hypothetical protein